MGRSASDESATFPTAVTTFHPEAPMRFALCLVLLGCGAGADTPADDTATPCTPGYGSVDVCVDLEGGFTVWASDSTSPVNFAACLPVVSAQKSMSPRPIGSAL